MLNCAENSLFVSKIREQTTSFEKIFFDLCYIALYMLNFVILPWIFIGTPVNRYHNYWFVSTIRLLTIVDKVGVIHQAVKISGMRSRRATAVLPTSDGDEGGAGIGHCSRVSSFLSLDRDKSIHRRNELVFLGDNPVMIW